MNAISNQRGNLKNHGGLFTGHLEQPFSLAAEMRLQLRTNAILNKPMRVTVAQAFHRALKDEADKIDRRVVPQHIAKPVAEMHCRSGRVFDGAVDQLRPS